MHSLKLHFNINPNDDTDLLLIYIRYIEEYNERGSDTDKKLHDIISTRFCINKIPLKYKVESLIR
jgi:hypothetical protein